ncbi:MAG: YdcF family protein [Clostridiales bacterium]|jgi:uncharacterized SAM-binding protein YcdF (DUF218 family)|nr:YdcF family protein [Clostridiales bacterium]
MKKIFERKYFARKRFLRKFFRPRPLILAAGLSMCAAALWLLFTAGLGNNTLYASGIAAALLVYGWKYERFIRTGWLNILIGCFAALYIGLMIFIAVYGGRDTATYAEDAVIVLGSGIKGEKISAPLERRLETAVEYHRKNPGAVIVVSGGQGPREDITEALAMERYLTSRGVPAEKILKEGNSLSTWENIQFSKEILDRRFPGDYSVAIVTNAFHIYRAVSFARQAGLNAASLHAGTPFLSVPACYIREAAAVVKLWVFKR